MYGSGINARPARPERQMNAEYFILDSLWLLSTQYTDFLREDWDILFNAPSHLELSQTERQSALDSMIKNNLLVMDGGWCKLNAQGGRYWENVFQVDWSLFHDYWFETLDEETEQLDFYCASEKTVDLFLEQHDSILAGCQIESLHNWPATYWKTLDSGFHLKHMVSADFSQIGSIRLPKWKRTLDDVMINT